MSAFQWLTTVIDTEHEKRVKIELSRGYAYVYLRHPTMRADSVPPDQQEPFNIYVTKLGDYALTYKDFKRVQDAINFVSCMVEEVKPQFAALMANPATRLNVY